MGDQYSGDEVRWDWLGCESGCSVSHIFTMNYDFSLNKLLN